MHLNFSEIVVQTHRNEEFNIRCNFIMFNIDKSRYWAFVHSSGHSKATKELFSEIDHSFKICTPKNQS